ncbi:MAG: ribonuclease [Candidatus Sumerlaeota bacterium]|nr:ribonuclease [Candidatus Sumerlaeota bacterium]
MGSPAAREELTAAIVALLNRMELPPPPEEAIPLLRQAFVHRSWAAEHPGEADNERLEFLGDSVIGVVTSRFLYDTCPAKDEGELSKLRASMVSRRILGKLGQELGIGRLLLLGVGEEASGGRKRSSIVGSALEAFCGALSQVYPFETCAQALRTHIVAPARLMAGKRGETDFKSRLQEWVQRQTRGVPEYRVVDEQGPHHDRHFTVEVWIEGQRQASGTGARIKWAENDAARRVLEQIELQSRSQGTSSAPNGDSDPTPNPGEVKT